MVKYRMPASVGVTVGQRTRRSVFDGSLSTTTTYTYEGLNLLSLSASRSDGATWSVSYFYDATGRAYAGVYEASDASATAFQMVTTDRGDVVEMLDGSGASFAAYRYGEWGLATETTSAATALVSASVAQAATSRQPLRYAGYCFDAVEGLYYLSARTYDPVTRQFLSKDPAKADGEESAYQYCGGDPVGNVDPTGLWLLSLPGLRLYVETLLNWWSTRWLYRPGGQLSGTYQMKHTSYLVRLGIHEIYLWLYTGYSAIQLAMRLGAAVTQAPRFLLNSPARQALFQKMKTIAITKLVTKYMASNAAATTVRQIRTSSAYFTGGNGWLVLNVVFVWSRPIRRLGS